MAPDYISQVMCCGMPPDPQDALSRESYEYLRARPKAERSPLGQFLTPRSLREALVAHVPLKSGMKVLDPGVGTGEFLATCRSFCPDIDVFGWDIDKPVLEIAKRVVPEAQLVNRSALDKWSGELFDVVIGNPPYFEIRGIEPELKSQYSRVISGRPNIFSLFFDAGWRCLKPGGYLAYVVPPSMNNGAYFEKLRKFIIENFSIEFLEVYNDPFLFEEVQTSVQLIVLRKGPSTDNYILDLGQLSGSPKSRTIFSTNPEEIAREFSDRKTLHQCGYLVSTGTVVWNNHKSSLSRTRVHGSVPLIWAHNITNDFEVTLSEDHPKRPQYIKTEKVLTGPALVVNRITGTVGGGSLRCAAIPSGMKFVAENHVNVITHRTGTRQEIEINDLVGALRNNSVNERVRRITGNTQLSASELNYWIPIDV